MTRKPTIADVARTAGVSKGLVSLTLNNRPGVAAQTRERIQAAADQLGWRPSPSARGLSNHRAYAFGLVVRRAPHIVEVDPFFSSFIAGVEEVLALRGQVLVLSIVPDTATELETYRRLSADGRVDGFFITDLLARDPRIELLLELGQQAVVLGRPDMSNPFPVISRAYERGIEDLTTHLFELGHRRIAHVTGDAQMQHAATRRDHFIAVAERLGAQPIIAAADFSPEQGSRATAELLDGRERPTAIIYANDPMAIAGMALAHERGLRLPDDLSIAGMDGSDMGRYTYPTLTTLDNDPVGWGSTAASALLQLIETGEAADVTLPPATLISRSSTGRHTSQQH
jgi:DNA-binding LacI/PurR family transcriptional regulator